MPRKVLSISRWWSPDTMTSACAATAHSRNRLSAGSSRMTSNRSVASTMVTPLGSVRISAHSSSVSVLTNRPNTSRYSWRTAEVSTSVPWPSRQNLTTSQQRPRHRLEITTLVSKTTLGFSTSRSNLGDQSRDVFGADPGALSRAAGAISKRREALRERPVRDPEPPDQLLQNLAVFNLFKADLCPRHLFPRIRRYQSNTGYELRQTCA